MHHTLVRLAWLCLALAAFHPSSAPAQISEARTRRPAAWMPFRWTGVTIFGRHEPRAALLVPVTLEGVPGTYYLQLDTGAGWPRWYEVPLRQLLPTVFGAARDSAPDEVVLRGRIGPIALAADTFVVEKGFGDSLSPAMSRSNAPRVIGTLGLRFFRDRRLVLDFPRQRLAIADSGRPLPGDAPRTITYLPARYAHGHLFVRFTVAADTMHDFFFDSGASALPLTTTMATWRQLTGLTGEETDTRRGSFSSWGRQLLHVQAPVTGTVDFGPFRFDRPLAAAEMLREGERDFFSRAPYPVGGHFGNALFFDRHVLIVDVSQRRFGVALGSSAAAPARRGLTNR